MRKKQTTDKRIIEDTLDRLYSTHRTRKEAGYWRLLILYFVTSAIVSISANSTGLVIIAGTRLNIYSFAGVLSSVANICVILLAVYYEYRGFLTGLVVLTVQLPIILFSTFARGNLNSLLGVFGNILAIIAIIFIYFNNKKILDYQAKIREVAVTDLMTGIPNGFACDELINALVSRKERFANVIIDINGFKNINDTMGFEAGNKVLRIIASRLKDLAESGTSGTIDFVGRTSGDEFSLLIRNFDSEEDLKKSLELYDKEINKKLSIMGYDFFISASIGYSIYPDDGDTIDRIISNSNVAMHEIKHLNSSNHILRYTADMSSDEKAIQTEGLIRSALENDTIFFMLQPQFDMDHKLRGFEALARMKDTEGNIISPGEFIPVAEKAGLIDKVDSAVFKKATAYIGEHIRKDGSSVVLSLNVSVRHLMKKDFIDEISALLKESGIPASQLEIEITESVMIESIDKAMDRINTIHSMGINIAIDDFGTGYSSLNYLSKFPANLLKIDKSFIDQLGSSERFKQYVAGIISLGHTMGLDVISEGVEENVQLETLREIGCDLIQGFIWGRPLLPEDASELLKSSKS